MRNLITLIVLVIFLVSCQKISASDKLEIASLAERYLNLPKTMESNFYTNDEQFKSAMKPEIDSLFASPLKEKWLGWVETGHLGSCYFSEYTKLVGNREVYQDSIVISSHNEIQYIAELNNHYSYNSEYDSINFQEFQNKNITNTTYDALMSEVDELVEDFTHFSIIIRVKEKKRLNFIKLNRII